ncbi:MAG: YbjQ family protein [Gemmatimonadales bacterium]|nr:YbjQ family protein [Gemmatimonadales bacterium]
MLVTTTHEIVGKRIVKTVGLVMGNTIRARHLGHDMLAGLKNLVGGEISDYTKMIAECREEALDRMLAQARENGANAVVEVRFATSEMMEHAAELLAYGTAVVVEDIQE